MFEQLPPRHRAFPLSKLIVSNPITLRVREQE